MKKTGDIKVAVKSEKGDQIVIEGKTAVPFSAFVKLILKRKVQGLFKQWQNEPVIISSDLLTQIASAPGDTVEDRSKIVLTAVVIGFCLGAFVMVAGIFILGILGIEIGQKELLFGLGAFLLVAVAVFAAMRVHVGKMRDELIEKVEQVAEVFGK
jgi:hypothetical protein